jgi:hypothetical protein
MKADERRVSFNLKPNLNILLVDLYHTESRKVLPSVERLFQDDTILWEFIHDYRKSCYIFNYLFKRRFHLKHV